MGIFFGGSFPGGNCPVGIIRVAIFQVRVFMLPLLDSQILNFSEQLFFCTCEHITHFNLYGGTFEDGGSLEVIEDL